jgi:hypothetical protein
MRGTLVGGAGPEDGIITGRARCQQAEPCSLNAKLGDPFQRPAQDARRLDGDMASAEALARIALGT